MNKGVAVTKDGEWDYDELHGIVMDHCYYQCSAINTNRAKGIDVVWYDLSLATDYNVLCAKVVENKDLVAMYDAITPISHIDTIDQFCGIISKHVAAMINANRCWKPATLQTLDKSNE